MQESKKGKNELKKQKIESQQKSDNEIKIHCLYDKLVDPLTLKPHPANPTKHPEPQVALLSKIMSEHGIRLPITVSKRSGFMVSGHCRCLSAMLLGLKEYPVVYQDFKSESEELAVLVADNRIAELSETDGAKLGDIIVELDQVDYPLELTALSEDDIKYYVEGPTSLIDKELPEIGSGLEKNNETICPKCGFRYVI